MKSIITHIKLKFETYLKGIPYYKSENKRINYKETRKRNTTKTTHQPQDKSFKQMDTQFNTNVYHFTDEVLSLLFDKYDGKVVGSEDMTKENVMKELFGDFKPGDKVAVQEQVAELEEPKETKKTKKKKKDPSEPKRPTTAFFFYTASIREEVKAKNPGKAVGELSKIYGQMWADLSEEEKAPFQEKNEKDKERYATEMEAWKKNNP